jgi:hypothetical protein
MVGRSLNRVSVLTAGVWFLGGMSLLLAQRIGGVRSPAPHGTATADPLAAKRLPARQPAAFIPAEPPTDRPSSAAAPKAISLASGGGELLAGSMVAITELPPRPAGPTSVPVRTPPATPDQTLIPRPAGDAPPQEGSMVERNKGRRVRGRARVRASRFPRSAARGGARPPTRRASPRPMAAFANPPQEDPTPGGPRAEAALQELPPTRTAKTPSPSLDHPRVGPAGASRPAKKSPFKRLKKAVGRLIARVFWSGQRD